MKKIFLMILMMSGAVYGMEMTNLSLELQVNKKAEFIKYLQKAIQEANCDEFDTEVCENKCQGCLFRTKLVRRLDHAQEQLIELEKQRNVQS